MTLSRQIIPKKITTRNTKVIHEDQFGFIWYGANDLYKYTGKRSKRYQAVLEDSIVLNFGELLDILEEPNGDLLLATAKGLFRYERGIDKIQPLLRKQFADLFGSVPLLQSLHKDSHGRLWLGGKQKLFLIDDVDEGVLKKVADFPVTPQKIYGAKAFCETDDGQIYVATNFGLLKVDKDLSTHLLSPEEFLDSKESFRISNIQQGNKDTLWLGGSEGLWIFEMNKNRFTPIKVNAIKGEYIRQLLMDSQQRLWFATKNKLAIRNPSGEVRIISRGSYLSMVGIHAIFQDKLGNIWTGGNNGIALLDLPLDQALPFYRVAENQPNQDNFFFRVMQDSSGGFWFRMLNSGLAYCPNLNQPFEIVLQPPFNQSIEEIKDFCTDQDGNVWVITLTKGLYLFKPGSQSYQSVELGDSILLSLSSDIIVDKHDDRLLWIASKFGLCSIDRFTFKRKWYHPKEDLPWLALNATGVLFQSDDGTIWCSLHGDENNTLGYFDKTNHQFNAQQNPKGIPEYHRIRQFIQAADNKVIAATNLGMLITDEQDKSMSFFGPKNGLPMKGLKSITKDLQGNIWLSSGNKLCKYDGEYFECYRHNSNIGSFIHSSATRTRDGLLLFGGSKGLHVFDPTKPIRDSLIPKVYLTGFRVFNKERKLEKAPELVQDIELQYHEKVFTFEFSAPHFVGPNKINYEYKLENFVNEWTKSGDEQEVTYTNLAPGDYIFKVRASSWNGLWTKDEQSLSINLHILPPWYRTWWAYILWSVLLISSILTIYRFQLNRRLAEAEAQRLKELNQAKSILYTNITHEFRTPLTIILGMTDQIKSDPKNWFNEGLRLIRRNGKQLLSLVNQLLDLSKLDSGNMPLKFVNGDIVSFLQYLTESFHSYGDSKDVRLHFSSDFKALQMDYDSEKLQNIVSNLLSNAVKFTQSGGDVYFDLRRADGRENVVLLQVRDNGVGIAADHLPYIFDRFYQVDSTNTRKGEGTGIGLSLTKELVQLMGGEIEVESELGKGTKFTILLPMTQVGAKAALEELEVRPTPISEVIHLEKQSSTSHVPRKDIPLVLLIEDNGDIITYLVSFLSSEYRIVTALDGKQGIAKAIELTPDLIVSDVMMPEKDGFEVCTTLKKDERTSHIPIILLTAKSDSAAKIEGLSHGADAYLAKPFNKEELLVRMEKLIELRKKLQSYFQKTDDWLKIAEKPLPTPEDLFLQKLIVIVEDNLSDEHFGLPDLCRKAGLSRSQLFRKLKALTGKSTTQFIRSIRLAKGKVLLETTNLNVSEVCFEVGFNNPNYFSKRFQEAYGMPPSSLRKG